MFYLNITSFALIGQLEKYHDMIETCCLKDAVTFFPKKCDIVFSVFPSLDQNLMKT